MIGGNWFFLLGTFLAISAAPSRSEQPAPPMPVVPLQIIGLTHDDFIREKGEGIKRCDTNAAGQNIELHAFWEEWFVLGSPMKVEYGVSCDAPKRVFAITLHFPAAIPRGELISQIAKYLGEPEQGESPKSVAALYYARWIKGGVSYDLEDFGGYRDMNIILSQFPNAAKYNLPADTLIIQRGAAEVTGDGQRDTILLLGKRFNDNAAFFAKLYLLLAKPGTGKGELIAFPANIDGGYQPAMQLCDFTGDQLPEIFVSAVAGGSGGLGNYVIYSLKDRPSKILFNSAKNILPTFTGQFEPNYHAKVLLKELNKSYSLDLSDRKSLYDEAGLYKNGLLPKPTKLWGGGYVQLTPVDTDSDGIYELAGIQQIRGLSNADGVGRINSLLKFRTGRWQLTTAKVAKIP